MMTNTEEESAPTDEEIIEALKTTVIWLHRIAGTLTGESARVLRRHADQLDSYAERIRERSIQRSQAQS
jgi:hypothetical protein